MLSCLHLPVRPGSLHERRRHDVTKPFGPPCSPSRDLYRFLRSRLYIVNHQPSPGPTLDPHCSVGGRVNNTDRRIGPFVNPKVYGDRLGATSHWESHDPSWPYSSGERPWSSKKSLHSGCRHARDLAEEAKSHHR